VLKLLLRLSAPFIAILLAAYLFPDRIVVGDYTAAAVFALVLSLLNAFVKPVVKFFSMPITCLTLGLFHFVLNALFFGAAAWVTANLGMGVHVDGFFSALLGSLVVSGVGLVVSLLTRDDDEKR
jgi:putative membrane protein